MTKDTVQLLDEWFDAKMFNIHTVLPGEIATYDASKRKAEVKPLIKLKMFNDDNLEIKNISNVPVMFQGNSDFSITYPLKKGDGVLLLFSECGLGKFLASGNLSDSDSINRFSLTDCIAIPSLWAFAKVPSKKSYIEVKDDGNIEIK